MLSALQVSVMMYPQDEYNCKNTCFLMYKSYYMCSGSIYYIWSCFSQESNIYCKNTFCFTSELCVSQIQSIIITWCILSYWDRTNRKTQTILPLASLFLLAIDVFKTRKVLVIYSGIYKYTKVAGEQLHMKHLQNTWMLKRAGQISIYSVLIQLVMCNLSSKQGV